MKKMTGFFVRRGKREAQQREHFSQKEKPLGGKTNLPREPRAKREDAQKGVLIREINRGVPQVTYKGACRT